MQNVPPLPLLLLLQGRGAAFISLKNPGKPGLVNVRTSAESSCRPALREMHHTHPGWAGGSVHHRWGDWYCSECSVLGLPSL